VQKWICSPRFADQLAHAGYVSGGELGFALAISEVLITPTSWPRSAPSPDAATSRSSSMVPSASVTRASPA
jgi:hypothetical protein